ncbi:MAG: TlpA family protein disulfide reductase [Hyphomicrobiaceae bacterium]
MPNPNARVIDFGPATVTRLQRLSRPPKPVTKLGVYADPTVRIHSGLKAIGMPATLLLDAKGREIGRLVGPAEWDSPEAKALIRAAIAAGG